MTLPGGNLWLPIHIQVNVNVHTYIETPQNTDLLFAHLLVFSISLPVVLDQGQL